jgi:TRAP-type C4-dicarboxylate transport system substrate-binding protein
LGKFLQEFRRKNQQSDSGQIHRRGALGKAPEQWEIAMTGAADICLFCSVYHAERMPLTLIIQLPFSVPDSQTGTKVLWQLYSEGLISSEYDENKLLAIFATGPLQIVTNKKITTADDFKGLKALALGPGISDMWKKLDAIPVEMTYPDVYIEGRLMQLWDLGSHYPAGNGWKSANMQWISILWADGHAVWP